MSVMPGLLTDLFWIYVVVTCIIAGSMLLASMIFLVFHLIDTDEEEEREKILADAGLLLRRLYKAALWPHYLAQTLVKAVRASYRER